MVFANLKILSLNKYAKFILNYNSEISIKTLITIIKASSIMVTVLMGKLKTAPKQAHCIFLLLSTDCKTPTILIVITTEVTALVMIGLKLMA